VPAPRRRRDAGFSLMEMLIVAAIMPVLFFAVFANMSSGLRTWKAFNRPVSEEETVLFIDRAQSDFANAFVYTSLPFTGDLESVSFAAPIQAPKELAGDRGIGRVGYRYDDAGNTLLREESDISEIFRGTPPRVKAVLGGVTGFRIEYLSYVPTESGYVWKEEWAPAKRPLPAAVRLTIDRDNGETLAKTFLVPCGN
jgi:prepilin-type N-terminal cleavage/methylation domain-containing protein